MTKASTKRDTYSTPGIDVDEEPVEPTGQKASFWNEQAALLKANPGKIGDHVFTPDMDETAVAGAVAAATSKDVRGGWKFYPGAESKAHDIPKRIPGIERRVGEHKGTAGLFMRFNPVLESEIKGKATEAATTAAVTATDPGDAPPASE